jgi:hypothetical protein
MLANKTKKQTTSSIYYEANEQATFIISIINIVQQLSNKLTRKIKRKHVE